jgi:hypothetical protein
VLICNCRRVIGRALPGMAEHGEYRVVKSRRWDCPSCGHDRKRTLAEMCAVAGVTRMVTLTFDQPAVPGDFLSGGMVEYRDGEFTRLRCALTPKRHRFCDWSTHAYWYIPRDRKSGEMGWRWRILSSCKHCCRWVSGRLKLWKQRIRRGPAIAVRCHGVRCGHRRRKVGDRRECYERRPWPAFEYLHAREVHKNGAMHLHVAVVGVPAAVTRFSGAGRFLKEQWREVGGGFVDVGRHGDTAGSDAGWYVGKYLAKAHDEPFAKGFRRWSRTREFARGMRMRPAPDPDYDGGWSDPGAPIVLRGWLTPDGAETPSRWWPSPLISGRAAARLDTSTANGTRSWSTVLKDALLAAREPVSEHSPTLGAECRQLVAF